MKTIYCSTPMQSIYDLNSSVLYLDYTEYTAIGSSPLYLTGQVKFLVVFNSPKQLLISSSEDTIPSKESRLSRKAYEGVMWAAGIIKEHSRNPIYLKAHYDTILGDDDFDFIAQRSLFNALTVLNRGDSVGPIRA